jgi:hypothetical protein
MLPHAHPRQRVLLDLLAGARERRNVFERRTADDRTASGLDARSPSTRDVACARVMKLPARQPSGSLRECDVHR